MKNLVDLFILNHESEGRAEGTIEWHSKSLDMFGKWLQAEG